jgi:AP-2 complex subunit sigma-1
MFFTIAINIVHNKLSYLETVHLFVELFDSYLSNVHELDTVFSFNKVYSILDEFMLAGKWKNPQNEKSLNGSSFWKRWNRLLTMRGLASIFHVLYL